MNGSSGARNATDAGGSGGDSSSSTSSRRTNRWPRTPSTATGTMSPASTSSSRSSFRADPLQDPRRDLGVLGEDALLVALRAQLPGHAVPRELARGQERQALVVCLEQLAPLVQELLAPGRLVAGDTRMQYEVVVPA